MSLTPDRGSLLRALSITQPKWRGRFDGAIKLCSTFAKAVTNVAGYTTEVCLVDAAYTYQYDENVKNRAREMLQKIDVDYLDYARRQDWEPGYSRAADRDILKYLQGEGYADYEMALWYDGNVSKPQGLPMVGEAVYAARLDTAREKLASDPFNPDLIEILTRPRFGATPGEDEEKP